MHNIKTTIAALALAGFSTLATAQTYHLVVPINGNVKNLNNGNHGGAPETPAEDLPLASISGFADMGRQLVVSIDSKDYTFTGGSFTFKSCGGSVPESGLINTTTVQFLVNDDMSGCVAGNFESAEISVALGFEKDGSTTTINDTLIFPSVEFTATRAAEGIALGYEFSGSNRPEIFNGSHMLSLMRLESTAPPNPTCWTGAGSGPSPLQQTEVALPECQNQNQVNVVYANFIFANGGMFPSATKERTININ